MMKKPIFFLYSVTIALLVSSCSTPSWVIVDDKFTVPSQDYTVDLPHGWRSISSQDTLVVTRDGITLQMILVTRKTIDKKLDYTQKKITKGMLPQEIAEVIADDIRTNPNVFNQKISENIPTTISDHPGFKLVYEYQTRDGLKKKGACYGLLLDDLYYEISYEAPARYYFIKDLQTFENVKETFRVLKKSPS